MKIEVSIDSMTPDLNNRLRLASNKTRIHRAMGMQVVALTKRAFNDPTLRPSPWPKKTDGKPATLRKSGTLAKSPRVLGANESGSTVGSDRHYAAIHQLGGHTAAHWIKPKNKKALKTPYGIFKRVRHPGSEVPPRPFFPFTAAGTPTARASADIIKVIDAALNPKA